MQWLSFLSAHRLAAGATPIAAASLLALCTSVAMANPVTSPFPVEGIDQTAGVAAAAYAGTYATTDTFENTIEIRSRSLGLLQSISSSQILALTPWMSLDAGPDGPGAVCLTASGRLAFVLVHDDTIPADGLGSDAILRVDVSTGMVSLFARLDAFDRGDIAPHLAMAHHRGVLYAGTHSAGVRAYLASANLASGSLLASWNLPGGGPIRGLTIDRDNHTVFAASDTSVYRASIPGNFATVPAWTQIVAASADIRALAWGDHYGAAFQNGLYILRGFGAGSRIDSLTFAHAYAGVPSVPVSYFLQFTTPLFDLTQTAEGQLLGAGDEDALLIRDDSDSRLTYDQWLLDEFNQMVTFARGLIAPDGEPAGWVIDADTDTTISRFHPATPDGACWTILALLMSDSLTGDPLAQQQVRSVLTRYAGLAPDNIKPSRSADGIFRHWINPLNGQTKPGWDPEFATLSTMKIVAGAARAMAYYPDDPQIVRAASRIIFLTKNWDAYIQSGTDATAFKGLSGGGADTGTFARPFHEGIVFAEQCATYGGTFSQSAYARWLNRALWPSATLVTGRPITSTGNNLFEAAFISLYPALLIPEYRASPAWQLQVANIRWSNGAWTDDNGPRFFSVFSAGTTRSDWGGYNADSLGNHPGNVTTFTSLMALSALGDTSASVGGYHAYRKGARQTFRTGASILFRRSDLDRSYLPNSAGLPDVVLGALALAEQVQPGSIDSVLAKPYPRLEQCPVDLNADGVVDLEDLYRHVQSPTDLNGDGVTSVVDARCLRNWCRRHESDVR